ncbi:MAG: hypothetical protein ACYSTS_17510 [Planctomycetota bacterium]|jgi:hypothetical protein
MPQKINKAEQIMDWMDSKIRPGKKNLGVIEKFVESSLDNVSCNQR